MAVWIRALFVALVATSAHAGASAGGAQTVFGDHNQALCPRAYVSPFGRTVCHVHAPNDGLEGTRIRVLVEGRESYAALVPYTILDVCALDDGAVFCTALDLSQQLERTLGPNAHLNSFPLVACLLRGNEWHVSPPIERRAYSAGFALTPRPLGVCATADGARLGCVLEYESRSGVGRRRVRWFDAGDLEQLEEVDVRHEELPTAARRLDVVPVLGTTKHGFAWNDRPATTAARVVHIVMSDHQNGSSDEIEWACGCGAQTSSVMPLPRVTSDGWGKLAVDCQVGHHARLEVTGSRGNNASILRKLDDAVMAREAAVSADLVVTAHSMDVRPREEFEGFESCVVGPDAMLYALSRSRCEIVGISLVDDTAWKRPLVDSRGAVCVHRDALAVDGRRGVLVFAPRRASEESEVVVLDRSGRLLEMLPFPSLIDPPFATLPTGDVVFSWGRALKKCARDGGALARLERSPAGTPYSMIWALSTHASGMTVVIDQLEGDKQRICLLRDGLQAFGWFESIRRFHSVATSSNTLAGVAGGGAVWVHPIGVGAWTKVEIAWRRAGAFVTRVDWVEDLDAFVVCSPSTEEYCVVPCGE
jgi:hypothetical protein